LWRWRRLATRQAEAPVQPRRRTLHPALPSPRFAMGPASVPRFPQSSSHAHTPTCSLQRRSYSQALRSARPHPHGTRGRNGRCTDPRRPDSTPRPRQPFQASPRLPHGGGGERRQVDKEGELRSRSSTPQKSDPLSSSVRTAQQRTFRSPERIAIVDKRREFQENTV